VKLLDTTVAIDHLRGDQAAVGLLRRFVEADEDLAASELVRLELLAGVLDHERDALERFFSAVVWVPVDEPITRAAGALARKYRASYGGIDDVDYLIAATAVVLEADLVTTNVRHFPMLPGVRPAY
jgi:predicted nucleic acid-binding protein